MSPENFQQQQVQHQQQPDSSRVNLTEQSSYSLHCSWGPNALQASCLHRTLCDLRFRFKWLRQHGVAIQFFYTNAECRKQSWIELFRWFAARWIEFGRFGRLNGGERGYRQIGQRYRFRRIGFRRGRRDHARLG